MKIKWYGHACFRIEGDGISIVTDPYTPEVAGLDSVDEPSDVVVMTSATDMFHSFASMVPGDPKVLNALEIARRGPVEANGVMFETLPTMESLEHKKSPDENANLPLRARGGEHLAHGRSGQSPHRRAPRGLRRHLTRGPRGHRETSSLIRFDSSHSRTAR